MKEDNASKLIKELYTLHSDGVHNYLTLMLGDTQLAEDLTHDAYIKAYKGLETYQEYSSYKTWLYTIARNVAIDYLRKEKRKKVDWFSDQKLHILPHHGVQPDAAVEIDEEYKCFLDCLKQLPDHYREVIIMRKIKELTVIETTEILGWSESKVKTTLHRAIGELKKLFEKERNDHD